MVNVHRPTRVTRYDPISIWEIDVGYRYGRSDINEISIGTHIDMVILNIAMGYGLMIWEMTVSIWSSWRSIWDILSLWPYPAPGPEARGVGRRVLRPGAVARSRLRGVGRRVVRPGAVARSRLRLGQRAKRGGGGVVSVVSRTEGCEGKFTMDNTTRSPRARQARGP